MATFTLDTKHTATLTGDTRSANANFTVDQHSSNGTNYLWTSSILPWLSTIQPWLITGGYPIFGQDIRH